MAVLLVDKKGLVIIRDVRKRKGSRYEPSNVTVAELNKSYVSITEANALLQFAYVVYTRRILHEDKLEGIKCAAKGSEKWFITKRSIAYYRERTSRNKAMRNYRLRFNKDQEDTVRSALDTLDIPYSLGLEYVKKG